MQTENKNFKGKEEQITQKWERKEFVAFSHSSFPCPAAGSLIIFLHSSLCSSRKKKKKIKLQWLLIGMHVKTAAKTVWKGAKKPAWQN